LIPKTLPKEMEIGLQRKPEVWAGKLDREERQGNVVLDRYAWDCRESCKRKKVPAKNVP